MRYVAGLSASGLRRRVLRSASVLWALLAAFGSIGAPVLHSFDAPHVVTRLSQVHAHLVDGAGGLHERGCPHTPPASHHHGGACLTCRTIQHSKFSTVRVVARPLDVLQPRAFLIDEQRPDVEWVDPSNSVPRAPPLFA